MIMLHTSEGSLVIAECSSALTYGLLLSADDFFLSYNKKVLFRYFPFYSYIFFDFRCIHSLNKNNALLN